MPRHPLRRREGEAIAPSPRCCGCCGGAVWGGGACRPEELSHVTKPSRSAHRACMKKGLCSSLLLLFFVQTLLLKGQAVLIIKGPSGAKTPFWGCYTASTRYFFCCCGERIVLSFLRLKAVPIRSCTAQCNVCKMHKQFHTQKNCYKCYILKT